MKHIEKFNENSSMKTEEEIREEIANSIGYDLKYWLENCTALGRDAYGAYIDKAIKSIQNKIIKG